MSDNKFNQDSRSLQQSQLNRVKELERGLFQLARALRKIRVTDETMPPYATGAGFWELVLLKHHAPIRSSDIAALLAIDISTVSRQIKQLEQGELVNKVPDAHDARASLLSLTDKGERVVDQLIRRRRQALENAFQGWTENDMETFNQLLAKFVSGLDEASEAAD